MNQKRNKLRKNNIPVFFDYKYNLKKSLSFASSVNARYAIIIGEEEVHNNSYTIKDLKKNSQKTILFDLLGIIFSFTSNFSASAKL